MGKRAFAEIISKKKPDNKNYGLVVKALDSQSRGPVFKTTEWLQD